MSQRKTKSVGVLGVRGFGLQVGFLNTYSSKFSVAAISKYFLA